MSRAAIRKGMWLSLTFWIHFFQIYAHWWDYRVADSSIFNFWRTLHTVFHTGYTNLHARRQCARVLFYLNLTPSAISLSLLFLSSPSNHCYQSKVLSHCGFDLQSLVFNNLEHFFIYLLAIFMSSLEKCLLRSIVHFWSRFFSYSCIVGAPYVRGVLTLSR